MELRLRLIPEPVGSLAGVLAVVILCVMSHGLSAATETRALDDSATVRARVEAYRAAWNTHDASAIAGFFAEDADLVMGNLPVEHGRQQIQSWWQEYFSRQESTRKLTLEVSGIRFIAAGVAIVNVRTATGGAAPDGLELPVRQARGTWLLQRDHDIWLISALRGFPQEDDDVVLNVSVEAGEILRPRLRAFVDAYVDAFNTHDASAVSSFFRQDADIIVRNAPIVHGRVAIEDSWRTYFSQPRPYRLVLVIDGIRMIAPHIALINLTATGAPAPPPEGEPLFIRYTRATWVAVREAGDWLIAALWVLPSEEDVIVRQDSSD